MHLMGLVQRYRRSFAARPSLRSAGTCEKKRHKKCFHPRVHGRTRFPARQRHGIYRSKSRKRHRKSASVKSRPLWADFTRWTATADGTACKRPTIACVWVKASRSAAPRRRSRKAMKKMSPMNLSNRPVLSMMKICPSQQSMMATAVIFFNFRGDRPREITRAFVEPDFKDFMRKTKPNIYYVCMTEYDASIPAPAAFPKPPKMKNILGAYWSSLGLKQFRCAETEKYAHVTFFFQ